MTGRYAMTLRLKIKRTDEWIFKELLRNVELKQEMGIDSSIEFEVTRLLRQAIIGDREQLLTLAKELGLYEKWKERLEAKSK
jgi:hypothetical protein